MSNKKLLKMVRKATNMRRKNFGSMRDLVKLNLAYEEYVLKKEQSEMFRNESAQSLGENKKVCDEASKIEFTKTGV